MALAAAACSDAGPTAVSAPEPPSSEATPSTPPTPPTPATPPASTPVPSATGLWTGAYLGWRGDTPAQLPAAAEAWAADAGRAPSIIKTFHTLDADSLARWGVPMLQAVTRAGAVNFVSLEWTWAGAPAADRLEAIARGDADTHLVATARALARHPAVVLVDMGSEMNGDWGYAWQGVQNGGSAGAAAKFVAAWRHVVDVLRREGATNVRWVFSPWVGNPLTWSPTGAAHWNWWGHYYPGDDYVDYAGLHGFNWGTPRWRSFESIFDSPEADHILSDMIRRLPNKPIIIGEYASAEIAGEDKGAWIAEAFAVMRRHPQIRAALWFNGSREANWRIQSSAAALAAYRAAEATAPAGAFAP